MDCDRQSPIRIRARVDRALVGGDDRARDREAQPRSPAMIKTVTTRPAEGLEQSGNLLRCYARSGVRYDDGATGIDVWSHPDLHGPTVDVVLDRVLHEVGDQAFEQRCLTHHLNRLDVHLDAANGPTQMVDP